jgi:hypothetical protein
LLRFTPKTSQFVPAKSLGTALAEWLKHENTNCTQARFQRAVGDHLAELLSCAWYRRGPGQTVNSFATTKRNFREPQSLCSFKACAGNVTISR